MRIISGKHGGLRLAEFNGKDIRPTADRVKESLFNILGSVEGARVLDLFCGAGGLGLECLSRGAAEVHFNDLSRDSIAVLNLNLRRFKGENFKVTNLDFAACLARVQPFDIIFSDPPYKSEAGREALEIIARDKLLTRGGIVVYERDRAFDGKVEGLEIYDRRKYGKTYLTFFRAEE